MSKLKPCPFCGGQEIEIDSCKGLEGCQNFEDCSNVGYTSVVCNVNKGGCGASSGYFTSVDKAIAAWNNRASGWIPFEFSYDNEKEMYVLQGELPKEGQEILVSNGRGVWTDTFLMDGEECYLDSGLLIVDSVIAWQPLPEPYHIGEVTKMVDSGEIGKMGDGE